MLLITRNIFCGTWYRPHSRVHKSIAELCSNFGDSAITKGQIAYFSLRMRKTVLFLLYVKILRHHRVRRPRFLITRGNFGDTWTLKADIAFFIFALIFRTSGPKMAIFRGKIGEGVGRYWPPTNSFLLLRVYTSVSNLVKIGKEMRPWESRHTDRQTHRQTDTNRFYYLYHAICYSYGADKKVRERGGDGD